MLHRRGALLVCSAVLSIAAPLFAQQGPTPGEDDFADAPPRGLDEQIGAAQGRMQQQLGDAQERQADEFARLSERMEAQYAALERRMAEQRAQFEKRVAQQWSDVQESTDKTWVDYGEKTDARSKVDFEAGEVEVEVLVPVEQVGKGLAGGKLDPKQDAKLRGLAEAKMVQQTQRMLAQREPQAPPEQPSPLSAPPRPERAPAEPPRAQQPTPEPPAASVPVLSGQLRGKSGAAVTEKDAARFVKEELAPKMAVDPKPVVGKDGKARFKVKVKVALVPGHLKLRADRYAAQINAQARKLDLDPALVFAVVHTESAFNPMARSSAGAYGLMQLIPRQGAHEAYRHIYKSERVVTPEYLFDPGNNLELGATYLQMLQRSFFGKVKSAENRLLLSIASYNCGPTKIRKTVIAGRDVDAMSAEEVVALVQRLAPEETRNYLLRVRDRMALYR